MKYSQKTAIAAAVAQLILITSGAAFAQSTPVTPSPPQSNVLNTVVVSGQRAALESAQNIKKNADEMVDSITADDIGKLPDRSVIEVLQRIPGIALDRAMTNDPQHFSVEGNSVAIRGLSFVRSEMNGRDSFSANGGRSLNFEDVPPELMSGVDVYKNPSASQIEGGVSGLVNLRTKLPFDSKGFKGAISADLMYSEMAGKSKPSASVLLSDRWKTGLGEFGLLVDLADSKSATRADQVKVDPMHPRTDLVPGKTVWVPQGAMWRSQDLDRDRKGQYVAAQWRPNNDLLSTLTYFKSAYNIEWSERFMAMQNGNPGALQVANGVYDSNGIFKSGTLSAPSSNGINFNPAHRVESRDSSTTDVALKVEWKVTPDWTLKTDLQRITAKTTGFASEIATGVQMKNQGLDLTGSLPKLLLDSAQRAQLVDPSQAYWAYTMDHEDRATAKSSALKMDLEYAFNHAVLRDVQFGFRATGRDSGITVPVPSYNWQGVTQPWMLGWKLGKLATLNDPRFNPGAGSVSTHGFDNFFGGQIAVPAGIYATNAYVKDVNKSYDQLHSYNDVLCQEQKAAQGWGDCVQYGKDGYKRTKAFGTDPSGANEIKESTQAFYTQLRFGFDDLAYPIDGNVGMRYVSTTSKATGFTVFSSSGTNFPAGVPVTGATILSIPDFAKAQNFDNTYTNLLPSLNLRMKASEKLQFRFAYAEAMFRPDFSQMQAYTRLSQDVKTTTNPVTGAINVDSVSLSGESAGNAMLKPVTSKQFDVSAEWYFAPAGSLTFAVFDKKLKDIVVTQSSKFAIPDAAGKMQDFTVTSPTNGASGTAKGFEIAYQQFYENLPGILKGFGLQASYTFVDSKRSLYNPVTAAYCSGGDSASNFNLWNNGCDTDGRTFGNLPLQGLSRQTVNLALMYESGPISTRLAYNWRSKYLEGVQNSWGTRFGDGLDTNPGSATFGQRNVYYALPLWAHSYAQVDASFMYKVTKDLTVGMEVQNLTNSVFKQTMQQHIGDINHAWIASGRRYSGNLRYTF
jgi:TonB-dependent receptor